MIRDPGKSRMAAEVARIRLSLKDGATPEPEVQVWLDECEAVLNALYDVTAWRDAAAAALGAGLPLPELADFERPAPTPQKENDA